MPVTSKAIDAQVRPGAIAARDEAWGPPPALAPQTDDPRDAAAFSRGAAVMRLFSKAIDGQVRPGGAAARDDAWGPPSALAPETDDPRDPAAFSRAAAVMRLIREVLQPANAPARTVERWTICAVVVVAQGPGAPD
jgi:hypothetical protein